MEQISQIKSSPSKESTLPFLKWAGGKRWLIGKLKTIIPNFSGRYIEPFLGSGAVFFSLEPKRALLSDSNLDLINTYRAVRENPDQILIILKKHQKNHSSEYYYSVRKDIPLDHYKRAARFIYLNRTCWNGLYRVNLNGVFNVPIGTKNNVLLESDNWQDVARILETSELVHQDFELSINTAMNGDLIFADPPYTVKHNLNGFVKYNDSIFSWSDQIRLKDALLKAKKRGAYIISTNACHQSIKDLYAKEFELESMTRASVLAGSAKHRGKYDELLIR